MTCLRIRLNVRIAIVEKFKYNVSEIRIEKADNGFVIHYHRYLSWAIRVCKDYAELEIWLRDHCVTEKEDS